MYWSIDKWQDEGKKTEGKLMHAILLKLQAGHMLLNLARFCGCALHYPSILLYVTVNSTMYL